MGRGDGLYVAGNLKVLYITYLTLQNQLVLQ